MTILPDVIIQYIFDFAFSGPYKLSYDIKSEKFIRKINPYYLDLIRINEYKMQHPPEIKTDYDLNNAEKIVGLYFTLPLKIPIQSRIGENEFLIMTYLFTVNLNTMIPYHCSIFIPYYYHSLTREYIKMHKKIYPTTTIRNFYLYKGLQKINYGYDTTIG